MLIEGNYSKSSKIIVLSYITLILLLISLMILSFPLGLYIVFISDLTKNSINTLGEFAVNLLRGLFTILWLFYLVLFIKAIQGPRLPLNKVPRFALNHGLKYIFDNTISTLAVTFSALFFIIFFIGLLQESAGIPTGSLPQLDPILMFFATSIAPIEEEIIFRVAIIGTISIILLLVKGRYFNPFKVLWHPSKYILELGKKADIKIIYFSIFISGFLFGYAHIAFGAGWEVGKVTQASLAGIVLGLIYFFYGFHGAVLLHWSFNYFMDSFYYYEILTYYALFIYIIIFGLASIIFFLIYFLKGKKELV
ncbi:MAG: CPBP family glutamic-type intramembrane protease [Nitrososphaerales archaeon]